MGLNTHNGLKGTADVLLRGLNTLAPAERELIAIHVSAKNDCAYCQTIHSAIAAHHLGGDEEILAQVRQDFRKSPIPEKLKALLSIAGKVRGDGMNLTDADVQGARKLGATDLEIHDTVLIAAAFCMYNRYVDGLATWQPEDAEMYRQRGKLVARDGYVVANLENIAHTDAG